MPMRPTSGMGVLRFSGGRLLWRMPGRSTEVTGDSPEVTTQPVGGFFTVPHAFFVVATGTAPLTYQWQEFSGSWVNLTDGATYTGTTTDTLTNLTPVLAQIRCVVTNDFGSDTSNDVFIATSP